MARYRNIVFIGLYFQQFATFLAILVCEWSVGVGSVSYTCAETQTISMSEGFSFVIYESSIPIFFSGQ